MAVCSQSELMAQACANGFQCAAQNDPIYQALVLQLLCNLTESIAPSQILYDEATSGDGIMGTGSFQELAFADPCRVTLTAGNWLITATVVIMADSGTDTAQLKLRNITTSADIGIISSTTLPATNDTATVTLLAVTSTAGAIGIFGSNVTGQAFATSANISAISGVV